MASKSQQSQAVKFQGPKGTRDFYPQDMAVRRYIESVWRTVSINHGFDEIDGPMFEHLDLYTHKSGPGIASELFQVFSGKDEAEIAQLRESGKAPFALRPEFTPTLARMVAAKANSLPMPIKWFAIPNHFRAERPQRGRLREFAQWNVDFIGERSTQSDIEVLSVAVTSLESFGLTSNHVRIKVNDRQLVEQILTRCGVDESHFLEYIALLDKRNRIPREQFAAEAFELGMSKEQLVAFEASLKESNASTEVIRPIRDRIAINNSRYMEPFLEPLVWATNVGAAGFAKWIDLDPSIVRGLAYYTGMVFEIHEVSGAERAIAGGGRYDNLIESFGGPKLPACGFGMGDVVLGNLLHDKGLLPEEVYMEPLRPHAFVISSGEDEAEKKLPQLVASLRRDGFHIRHSYRSTRNVGKLLSEAAKSRARYAIILGKELAENQAVVKNLESGEQSPVALSEIVKCLRG